jgi:hypothetical protein
VHVLGFAWADLHDTSRCDHPLDQVLILRWLVVTPAMGGLPPLTLLLGLVVVPSVPGGTGPLS